MRKSLTIAVAALLTPATWAQEPQAPRRPNIVYIVADDLGYADLGCQGSKEAKTPHIDSIASNGVRFTNGYVTCPVCSPTRAALLTGRYQQRFGHEFNPGPNEADNFGLPTDQITMPQTFREAGYATGMVGKWHLGFRPEMHPLKRGFDTFFGFTAGAHPYNAVGRGRNAIVDGEKPVEAVNYLTDDFGREAVRFIERHRTPGEKPFFLYLAFNAVHDPLEASPKYLDRFPDMQNKQRRTMLAMLSAMDDAVGQVLTTLRTHELEQDTIVVFQSDNGGPMRGNHSGNEPFRGTKGTVYEGGVRVPFLAQWPRHLRAGTVSDLPISTLDAFPTLLAAANVEPPKGVAFDGLNLLPFLGEQPSESRPRSPGRSFFWRFGPQWAVRDGDLKLLHRPAGGTQLYDLARDPGETANFAAERPDEVQRLTALYAAWDAQNEAPRWRDSRDEQPSTRPANTATMPREAD